MKFNYLQRTAEIHSSLTNNSGRDYTRTIVQKFCGPLTQTNCFHLWIEIKRCLTHVTMTTSTMSNLK